MDIFKDEVTNDPVARGYNGPGTANPGPGPMTDQQVTDDMRTAYRTRSRETMTASEVANAIDITEFNALSAGDEEVIWNVLHLGELNPFGIEATIFTSKFGGGSDTIVALAAARVESITRAQELGVRVGPGLVNEARR